MKNKPRRSIFLLAAELEAMAQVGDITKDRWITLDNGKNLYSGIFSCCNISQACFGYGVSKEDHLEFYENLFRPVNNHNDVWWPRLEDGEVFDFESRILALLLAAEMLRR